MPTITKPYGDFTNNVDVADAVKVNAQLNTLYTGINGNLDSTNVPTLGNVAILTTTVKSTAVAAINEIDANRPKQSLANITYFVNTTTGNDGNDGLTSGTPFKTVQYAVSRIPQIVNHTVIINVAAGTYAEDLVIPGFPSAKGSLAFVGDSIVSTSRPISSITISNCSIPIALTGFNPYITSGNAVTVVNCTSVLLDKFNIVAAATSQRGISTNNAVCKVSNSTISNRAYALIADEGSQIISATNTGTGNTTGIFGFGGVVRQNGTQPGGTTASGTAAGGQVL